MPENDIIASIIQESLLLVLIMGSVCVLLLSLLFLSSPQQALALSLRLNRWISLRKASRPLEIPHSIEPLLYKHNRKAGLFIILSVAYILYRSAFDVDHIMAIQFLSHLLSSTTIFEWLLLPVSALLLIFGTILALKPSALKGVEKASNHWISTRKIFQFLEKRYNNLDHWVALHPRLYASLLFISSCYALLILFPYLSLISHISH